MKVTRKSKKLTKRNYLVPQVMKKGVQKHKNRKREDKHSHKPLED